MSDAATADSISVLDVERKVSALPQVAFVFSKTGTAEIASDPMPPNASDTFIILKPQSQWPDPKLSKDALLKQIVADISAREGVHAVVAQHRVGHLDIGGVALFVAVATSHRREGFEAASDLVERVKEELPIWKKQFFTDGSHEWSQCP